MAWDHKELAVPFAAENESSAETWMALLREMERERAMIEHIMASRLYNEKD